jgi:hypothetical protein
MNFAAAGVMVTLGNMMVRAFKKWTSDFGDAIVHRADGDTLRVVKLALAVGALGGVDDVDTLLDADGHVGAFGLTGITAGAGFGVDLVGHGDTPVRWVGK